ncbi:MAG TPA: DUF934 domain-containing protein [Casimicrobiaceae bacterium]|nr:DUF934 domain-containing protein [Casimicrobiaceae bacterium]
MPRLIRNRVLADDRYTLLRSASTLGDVPDGVSVIVPLALWTERRVALIARGETGVWLAPADDPAALAADVTRLSVIAVDFPQFTDGRGYSHARLLRERYGYGGELRAIGDVGRDQLYDLAQCGFDAFEIPDGRDAAGAIASFADFSDGYQATFARAPWFRRRKVAMAVEKDCISWP